jgi:hypothetical protein
MRAELRPKMPMAGSYQGPPEQPGVLMFDELLKNDSDS